MNLRNTLFVRGVLPSHDLGAPTISVGNITTGGTGKTPHVAAIAELVAATGHKVCILTRGYGRDKANSRVVVTDGAKILATPRFAGDEPFELALKLLGKAVIIADPDRVGAAAFALREFGVTAFILDDGFQHRRANRDLDIVLIDATDPFSNRQTLPFGRLREPLQNLKRAGLIVISRANLAEQDRLRSIRREINEFAPECDVIESSFSFGAFWQLDGFGTASVVKIEKEELSEPFAFCALGNPENFFAQLRREGFGLKGTLAFPDHRRYSEGDLKRIEESAKKAGASCFVTTPKDAVKLNEASFDLPCYVAESSLRFDDEKKLREAIRAVLKK